MNITPAILPHGFQELNDKLTRIDGLAPMVQIDLCDGVFGLEKTWMPEGGESLSPSFEYEYDLMVVEWKPVLEKVLTVTPKAKQIVLHADRMSDEELLSAVGMLKDAGVLPGIAVSNDVSTEAHIHLLHIAREINYQVYAQVMGISHIGEQGQSFDESAPSRIVSLKQNIGDVLVQVDGAMNPTNGPKVIQAGAERLVVGSYIFSQENPAQFYEEMTNIPSFE